MRRGELRPISPSYGTVARIIAPRIELFFGIDDLRQRQATKEGMPALHWAQRPSFETALRVNTKLGLIGVPIPDPLPLT